MQATIAIITVIVAGVAVYTDTRWGKVYNYLTLPTIALGLILNTIASGPAGLLLSLGGIGVAFAVFLFSSALGRILGGGDIKLLGAIGALQGASALGMTLVYTGLIGGLLAIVVALVRGVLWQRMRALASGCYLRAVARVPMEIEGDAQSVARLPYAIPICLGTLAVLLTSQM